MATAVINDCDWLDEDQQNDLECVLMDLANNLMRMDLKKRCEAPSVEPGPVDLRATSYRPSAAETRLLQKAWKKSQSAESVRGR